jgi:hypothetical protein
MVTIVLAGPLVGAIPVIFGGGITVKVAALDGPPCVTMTGPVVEPVGTGETI